jgi:hypothetical protein
LNADGVTDGQDFIIWNDFKFQSSDRGADTGAAAKPLAWLMAPIPDEMAVAVAAGSDSLRKSTPTMATPSVVDRVLQRWSGRDSLRYRGHRLPPGTDRGIEPTSTRTA